MKATLIGFAFLAMAFLLLTSPYWLYREIVRPDGEELPEWMGNAGARKKRLAAVLGVIVGIGGAVLIAAGLSEP